MSTAWFSRFATFLSVQDSDLEDFELLRGSTLHIERRSIVRLEGSPAPDVYFLRSGWLACSVTTGNGGRQITKVHLPGDLVGLPSLASDVAAETIEALSDATVDVIPLDVFGTILRDHYRLAGLLLLWSQEERVRLMHQMTLIGRSEGPQRIAAFILSIYRRLQLGAPDMGLTFSMPLTQQDIGDATGMTTVHANRTLKVLRDRRLVEVVDGKVTILNLDGLAAVAGMPAEAKRSTTWL